MHRLTTRSPETRPGSRRSGKEPDASPCGSAGNTTTLAHYIDLLAQSGLVAGVQKASPDKTRTRGSSSKLLALDPSLATSTDDRRPDDWLDDAEARGHLIESVVGAHLWHAARASGDSLRYWTDGKHELDFVYARGKKQLAIEVKSGRRRRVTGLAAYKKLAPQATGLLVGPGGVPLPEFLETVLEEWWSKGRA
jgi:predicted AAA+ superfamily ATPase